MARNPVAKSLRSPHLRNRVVPDKRTDAMSEAELRELVEEGEDWSESEWEIYRQSHDL